MVATHRLHLAFAQIEEVLALEPDRAADDPSRRVGDEAQHGEGRHTLAAARLPDHPQCFAGPHGKGNPINRTYDAGSGEEISPEIVDLQQRGRIQLLIGAWIFNGSYAIQE